MGIERERLIEQHEIDVSAEELLVRGLFVHEAAAILEPRNAGQHAEGGAIEKAR
jgi:hypothetical protein